jgi:hypothetical protein
MRTQLPDTAPDHDRAHDHDREASLSLRFSAPPRGTRLA